MTFAVLFDVDGVLADSLPAHLETCETLSALYGLGLQIPGAEAFRMLVRSGVPISPMQKFFEAVGFPPAYAARADVEYEASFASRFSPCPFPGVSEMLRELSAAGIELGIVSSNTLANVRKALGPLGEMFVPTRIYTRDHSVHRTKPDALRALVRELGFSNERVFYVGDQPSDALAARAVGLPFVGATYGWGIGPDDAERVGAWRLVDRPERIAVELLAELLAGR
jgi:phosphoglycolate phosphatase-like HAD superfamily hydrolase